MMYPKLPILVPVVALLLFNVEAKNTTDPPTTNASHVTNVSSRNISRTTLPASGYSSEPVTTAQSNGKFTSPHLHFSSMVKRLALVAGVLSLIVGLYILVKFCRSGKRKARKYGVVKTPGDLEMRPLESDDDDDDEDVTMFNRKN